MGHRLAVYFLLLFGAVIQGIAMSVFLFPHSIPSGEAAGIAIIANYFFQLPLGFALWLANAIFLVFALQYFGFTWTVKTIVSVAITSTVVSVMTDQVHIPHIHIFIDLLFGSVLFGIGVGMLIRVGSSSGGMVIPALMIATYKNWNPGKVMFVINFLIFVLTSVVIDYKIIVYAILCQFFSSNIIDFIYGLSFRQIRFLLTPSWRRK